MLDIFCFILMYIVLKWFRSSLWQTIRLINPLYMFHVESFTKKLNYQLKCNFLSIIITYKSVKDVKLLFQRWTLFWLWHQFQHQFHLKTLSYQPKYQVFFVPRLIRTCFSGLKVTQINYVSRNHDKITSYWPLTSLFWPWF